MKIVIKESNRTKLQSEIEKIQKRTTRRNITVDDLFEIVNSIENKLSTYMSKNKMIGIVADVDYNAQDFPKSYKYIPESTRVKIEKVASGWALTRIGRDICRRPKHRYILSLTDEAKKAILEGFMREKD